MDIELPVLIRKVKPADIPCITNNWLESYRKAARERHVPNSLYYDWQHRIMELTVPYGLTLVTCNANREDQILAWACFSNLYDDLIVHYAYTKQVYRKMGFQRRMLEYAEDHFETDGVIATHLTPVGNKIAREHGFEYNPYLLYTELDWNYAKQESAKAANGEGRSRPEEGVQPSPGT